MLVVVLVVLAMLMLLLKMIGSKARNCVLGIYNVMCIAHDGINDGDDDNEDRKVADHGHDDDH